MGLGSIKKEKKKMNKHCDFLSIELAYEMIDRLGLNKRKFANLCGITAGQFRNWEKKGRMPQYRYSQLIIELKKVFKEEYDRKLKLLEPYE